MKSGLNISSIQIVRLIISDQGLIFLTKFAQPWCIFLRCHSSLVGSFFTVEEDSTSSVFLLTRNISTFSVIIINKIVCSLISYLLRDIWAHSATNAWSNSIEIINTSVAIICGVVGSVDHVEAPHCLWYTWCIIKVPISCSVSNGHTLEVVEGTNWSCDVSSVRDVIL